MALTNVQKQETEDFYKGDYEYETTRKDPVALERMYLDMKAKKAKYAGKEGYCCGKQLAQLVGKSYCTVCGSFR